jgi:SAM-dependent methyltransferase
LKIPSSEKGFIPSLNHYGYMLETPDEYSQKFINYAEKTSGFVLDIGAAYGVSTIPALKAGAYVIANDLDFRHLYLLWHRITPNLRERLSLKIGKFPREVDFPPHTFEAILASGVLHYLPVEELEEAFKKIFDLLVSKGKFFFFTSTPYLGLFKEFLPIFYQRKAQKEKWPGLISNSWIYAPHRKDHIPNRINLLDEETLMTLFLEIGFQIEEKSYVAMVQYPKDIQSGGKEYIGFVLKKP